MQTSRTLTIPQPLYERIRRVAKSQHRELSEVAAAVLEEGLPLLESQLTEPDWQSMSLASFTKDWDNPEDAIYDNWREFCGIPAG